MSTHLVQLDAGHLFVESAGAGTALVFLHGFGLDCRMWDPQFEEFARDFHVIRYDFRGFGRFALRFVLAYPEEVRSLVLVDSALDGHVWSPEWKGEWTAIQGAARAGDVAEARRRWLGHPLFPPACERATLARVLQEQIECYSGWHWVNRDTALIPHPPVLTRLGRIRQPTLVLVGDRDLPDFNRIGAILAREIPRARLQTVLDSGHMANLEAPAPFNAFVSEFLRHQERTGGAGS